MKPVGCSFKCNLTAEYSVCQYHELLCLSKIELFNLQFKLVECTKDVTKYSHRLILNKSRVTLNITRAQFMHAPSFACMALPPLVAVQ